MSKLSEFELMRLMRREKEELRKHEAILGECVAYSEYEEKMKKIDDLFAQRFALFECLLSDFLSLKKRVVRLEKLLEAKKEKLRELSKANYKNKNRYL